MSPLKSHVAAFEKAKAIVCEKSLKLLDDAHDKKPLPKPTCETSVVDENVKLAERLGLTGVPAIILSDGRIIPGYRDAQTLINLIVK